MSKQSTKLSRSDIFSFIAIITSMIALGIGIYEAKIMKEQQKIMASQQHFSVWPYIEVNTDIKYGDTLLIDVSIENKGIGPAIVQNLHIVYEDHVIYNYAEFFEYIGKFTDVSNLINMNFGISNVKKILKPGEQLKVLHFEIVNNKETLSIAQVLPSLQFCYCSVYEDCWDHKNLHLSVPCLNGDH